MIFNSDEKIAPMDLEKFGRLTVRRELGNTFLDVPDISRKEFESVRDLSEKEMISCFKNHGISADSPICSG